jgi:Na+-transporting NADH:ubiquinone oxidoreductase subunit NqrB
LATRATVYTAPRDARALKASFDRRYSAAICRFDRHWFLRNKTSRGSRKLADKDQHSALFAPLRAIRPDPRIFQILALGALLVFGLMKRAFSIEGVDIAAIFATALATQWAMSAIFQVRFEAKSALITALSLTLLLRANTAYPLIAAAFIAISSKFILRSNDKHIFNPANIGIVAVTLLSGAAWTTPGQWGTAIWLAAIIAGAGFFVTYRVSRLDTPLIFLGAFAALIIARALWLGDPLSIPMLRLQNGALILFAFFMISDPKTTPDGLIARAIFAAGAALLSYIFIYHFYRADGVFYALAVACLARPLIERFDPARAYRWSDPPTLKPIRNPAATPAE